MNNASEYSRPSSRSNKSSDGDNKLADLNNLLKNGQFNIKEDDELEFQSFLKTLQQKQKDDSPQQKEERDAQILIKLTGNIETSDEKKA